MFPGPAVPAVTISRECPARLARECSLANREVSRALYLVPSRASSPDCNQALSPVLNRALSPVNFRTQHNSSR